MKEIFNKTIEDIIQQCSCVITVGLKLDTQLKCLPGNDKAIVFETRAYASNQTITLLEQSLDDILYNESSNVITVRGNTLTLTNDSICSERTTANTMCYLAPPSTDPPAPKSDHDNTGVIVGVVSSLLIILLAITAAVILVIFYYKKRHSYR